MAAEVVGSRQATYQTTDATVESQIVEMKTEGCEVFVNTAIPKFAAQAIRKAADISGSRCISSAALVTRWSPRLPAGFDKAAGIVSIST